MKKGRFAHKPNKRPAPSQSHRPSHRKNFQKFLPDGKWDLVKGDNYSGSLLYRNAQGKEVLVPNIWYNQPVATNIETIEHAISRQRASIIRWQTSSEPWACHEIEEAENSIRRMEDLIFRMKISGKPLRT